MPVHPPLDLAPSPRRPVARSEVLIAAAVLAVVAASVPAQRQFEELRKRGLPAAEDRTFAVALGDVDGDGDLDAVLGNDGPTKLYLNDGQGVYTDGTAAGMPADGDATRAVALGDVDGDGDVDLVLANDGTSAYYGQQNRLYLNDGTGRFTDATATHMPADTDFTQAVALGDVDGDGDLDLVFGNSGGPYSYGGAANRLYLNDGTGRYTDGTIFRLPTPKTLTQALALGDVDGDGDLDLVAGNGRFGFISIEQDRLYLNDGTGRFTDVTATRLPARLDLTYGVALGDVDGDGDLDLVLADYRQQNRLYVNDGTGRYTDATAARLPVLTDAARAVALGDVDLDGDLDLIFGSFLEQSRLYANDGTGTFTDVTAGRLPAYIERTQAVAMGDVDGDGDLDTVVGNAGSSRLYLNDGAGSHTDATASPLPDYTDSTGVVVLGDVDGDGDLDLVAGNGIYGFYGPEQSRLYLNDGDGHYDDATVARMPALPATTAGVVLGDVDRDGDLDMVFGNGSQNRLYLNDGTGTFTDVTAARMPVDNDDTRCVAMGDVDGDGDLDLVFGNAGYNTGPQYRLYFNDGQGRFTDVTAGRLGGVNNGAVHVALGDVDGDGDLDLVSGDWKSNYGRQNRLYLNDGTGHFADVTAARMPAASDRTVAVAFGDVDGDGDLDLIFGEAGQNLLYLNGGQGDYTDVTATHLPAHGDWTVSIALGDVDGDGDLDLIFGNSYFFRSRQNRFYLNDGTGHYADATAARFPVDDDDTSALALGDVDADGDVDVVLGTMRGPDRIYQNLLRQLDAPYLLRTGHTYTLEAYARYGAPSLVSIALPLLSTATANVPVPPFGELGLDPMRAVSAPAFLVPQPAGVGSISFTVPVAPSLVGLSLYAQALLVPYPLQARLTNVTADVLIR